MRSESKEAWPGKRRRNSQKILGFRENHNRESLQDMYIDIYKTVGRTMRVLLSAFYISKTCASETLM